jgi:hypothetical protein
LTIPLNPFASNGWHVDGKKEKQFFLKHFSMDYYPRIFSFPADFLFFKKERVRGPDAGTLREKERK